MVYQVVCRSRRKPENPIRIALSMADEQRVTSEFDGKDCECDKGSNQDRLSLGCRLHRREPES